MIVIIKALAFIFQTATIFEIMTTITLLLYLYIPSSLSIPGPVVAGITEVETNSSQEIMNLLHGYVRI